MRTEVELQESGQAGAQPSAILMPGRNCCGVAPARRAAFLIDAEAYFAALENALRLAQRSIFIMAWDFDARIQLRPQDGSAAPTLGDLLRKLVEERPELEVRILVWSLAAVHTPSAAAPLLLGAEWQRHPRIQLRLDTHHPLHAAHHQKIVTIDDSLAFVGGMDLTIGRWDTPRHEPKDPRRLCPDGTPYDPVHDLQMAVDGPVSRVVAKVVRERWCDAVGEEVPFVEAAERWPQGLEADFTDVPVGVARTAPRLNGGDVVEEIAVLTDDLLQAAEKTIYIEAQYFTARRLRRTLRGILARPQGPEVVVICTLHANGMVERFIMGANRERLLRSLKRSDPYNRLRLYCPVVDGTGEQHMLVHAKLMIIDDRLLRVGSANLNNRSIGLDTECDLVVEADRPETSSAIAACRDRLVAEHLDVDPALVRAAMKREGSLIRAIERLNRKHGRCLCPLDVKPGSARSFPGTRLLDPERPFHLVEWARGLWRRKPQLAGSEAVSRDRKSSDVMSSMLPSSSGNRK